MPRPRNSKNRGLPPNLYEHTIGSYRFKKPDGTFVYLGYNRPAAIQAALGANAHFAAKTTLLEKILQGDQKSLGKLIDDFVAQKLPKADVSDKTRDNRRWELLKIQKHPIAHTAVDQVTTRDLHGYIESLDSDWVKQSRRAILGQLFKWSIQIGLREDNPAANLDSATPQRKRDRLDYETFTTLHAAAPTWLQNAMTLQLHTLQRPGDVLAMQWDQVQDGWLCVIQQKTNKRLKLKIQGALQDVIEGCRDGIASPYLVHRLPERLKGHQQRARKRLHHTQVLLPQADRELAKVRISTGLYAPGDSPPTLHEIRSLGGSLYRDAGWTEEQVQALMGHTTVKMTRYYLDGHDAPWDEVSAGLTLP